MATTIAPAPQRDIDSEFYWRGLERHRLLLQRCNRCAKVRFPPMPACCYCGAGDHSVVQASGRATLYSWVVVHHAFSAQLEDAVPYAIGTLQLSEGCRMVARLDDHRELRPGGNFTIYYVQHQDWVEARFRKMPEA